MFIFKVVDTLDEVVVDNLDEVVVDTLDEVVVDTLDEVVVDNLGEVDTFVSVTDVIAVSRWEEVSFTSR